MVLENFLADADILWDRAGKKLFEKPEARTGRIMRVQVTNRGVVEDLTGYTLNLGWTSTKDETKIGLDAFEAADITKGIFELEYTSGMLTNIGTLKAALQLVPAVGNTVESDNFVITVTKSAVDAEAIQSESSFSTLTTALVQVNGWNATIGGKISDWEEDMAATKQLYIDNMEEVDATYPIELNSVKQQLAETNILSAEAVAKANAMASGSPKGVYATLALLQAAYPTGTTGAYLVTADGNWYYWNGSAWVSGGVYQATGIQDWSIEQRKLITPALSAIKGKNLFDKTRVISGQYVRYQDGNLSVGSGYYASEFIPVAALTSYTIQGTKQQMAFYDSNKVYTHGMGALGSTTTNTITTLVTDAYIRITVNSADLNLVQVELGVTASNYEAYNTYYFDENTIKDKISEEKLDVEFVKGRKSINLLNRNVEVTGFLSSLGGIDASNGSYATSYFIPVIEGKSYVGTYHTGQWFLCAYNINKALIGSRTMYNNTNISFSVASSSGIAYVRVSYLKTLADAQIQEGNVLTPYEDFNIRYLSVSEIPSEAVALLTARPSCIIKVAKDNGDYNTLTEAVAAAVSGDTIIVYPGIYDNEQVYNTTKDISIVGVDKTSCIIQNSKNVYGSDPITMTQGHIANLTVKALASVDYVYNSGVSECYCLHIDTGGAGKELLVENCNFYSYHWACLGIGLHQDQKIKVKNCEMYNMQSDVPARRFAALFHQRAGEAATNQKLIFENCLMRSKAGYAFNFQDVQSQMELTMYKNIIFDDVNGTNCLSGNFNRDGDYLSTSHYLTLGKDSFGNNVSTLNF